MWWFVGILGAVILVLAFVLARRGSTGGSMGSDTPGTEARAFRRGSDSGMSGGG